MIRFGGRWFYLSRGVPEASLSRHGPGRTPEQRRILRHVGGWSRQGARDDPVDHPQRAGSLEYPGHLVERGTGGHDVVYDGYAGMMVLKASSDNMPTLLSRQKRPIDIKNSPFYGGCFVQGIARIYGTVKGGAPGLFATLEAVRFWDDGESFGAARVGADAFDGDDDEDDGDADDMLD